MKIYRYPSDILFEKAEPVTDFGEEFQELVSQMREIMFSEDGVGLAAPQVGVGLQVLIAAADGENYTFVNPKITDASGEVLAAEEGCLSFPGIYASVPRPSWIELSYMDEKGRARTTKAEGFLARVCCHEIDHLNGRLLIDHVSILKRQFIKKRMAKLKKDEQKK